MQVLIECFYKYYLIKVAKKEIYPITIESC